MEQLNLFTNKHCSHCKKDLAPSAKNPHLADGFQDQDTGELVHWGCKETHYKKKKEKGLYGLWSEVPIMI